MHHETANRFHSFDIAPYRRSDFISESTKAQSQKALAQSYLRAAYRYNVVLDHLTR
jgi:hypothetical protein